MDNNECAVKRDPDDAEVLMDPLFVPVKVEHDFEGSSEETIMEENLEATENTEENDSSEYAVKREIDRAEVLMEPLFVPVKTEPEFENGSEETIVEEKFEGSEIAEDFSKTRNQQPHIEYPALPCNSQFASSTTQLHSKMVGMNTQKHFWNNSLSCQHGTVLQSRQSQEPSGEKSKRDRFKCATCEKKFASKSTYVTHMRTHTGERPFICSQCGVSFTQKNNLSAHIKIHSEEKPFKCSQCGTAFRLSKTLTVHMRTHSGEKPYKCPQCQKSFSHSCTLAKHMRSHSGERPYRCSHCGQSFSDSSVLTSHLRSHAEDRPYKCSQCIKSFTRRSHLTAHMRKHTGDQPYKCSQCELTFKQSSHLAEHMQTHTGEQSFSCTNVAESASDP